MATKTLGTNANNSLIAIQWQPGNGVSIADLATLQELIKNPEQNVPLVDSCRIENGFLFLPGKRSPGGILLLPGDWIGVDNKGWPIVVAGTGDIAAGGSSWTHS